MNNTGIHKLVRFLESVLGPYQQYPNKEYYFQCPFCVKQDGKKKLAIKLDKNGIGKRGEKTFTSYHCWRDTSHIGSNLYVLLKRLNRTDLYPTLTQILKECDVDMDISNIGNKFVFKSTKSNKHTIQLPAGFKSLSEFSNDIEYKNAMKYVTGRGVTYGDIIKYNIGYCDSGDYMGYIIFPSYDNNGELNFFTARSYYNVSKKHRTPSVDKNNIIFNELHIDWSKPITLVEGPFDLIAVKLNVIPILGKYIPDRLIRSMISHKVKIVYLALDDDALKDSIKHIELLLSHDIDVKFVDVKQYGDPSKAGFYNFWKLAESSPKITFLKLLELKMSIK